MYEALTRTDRNFKRIGPKITKENVRSEWAHIFNDGKLEESHSFFHQEKSVDPLNLILKKYRTKQIYQKITISDLEEIQNKFKKKAESTSKSATQTPPEASELEEEVDEGTDCNSETSGATPTGSPSKTGLGEARLDLGFGSELDAALSSSSKTKSFFEELKRESNAKLTEQLSRLTKRTNKKIDDQLDFLSNKFCTQLEIIEKDVAELDSQVQKNKKANQQMSEKVEAQENRIDELD